MTSMEDPPFPQDGRILEVGCGNGKTALALLSLGYEVTAVDISSGALEACRLYAPEAECVKASVSDLPFEDGTFDGAVLFHVMEHILPSELPVVSREIARVLRPGCSAIVRSFLSGDLKSEKGEPGAEGSVIRGNGIRYVYRDENSFKAMFPDGELISFSVSEEDTRFGGRRRRGEAVFRFPDTES